MSLFLETAPWITSAGALTMVGIVRRHPVTGFTLGLAYQPIWVAYSLMTHSYGFLLATVGFVSVNAYQLRASLRARAEKKQEYLWGVSHSGKRL